MSDLDSLLEYYANEIPYGVGRAAHYRYLLHKSNDYPETVAELKQTDGVTVDSDETLRIIAVNDKDGYLIHREDEDERYYAIEEDLLAVFVGVVARRTSFVVTRGEELIPNQDESEDETGDLLVTDEMGNSHQFHVNDVSVNTCADHSGDVCPFRNRE